MRLTADHPKAVPSIGDRILQRGLDATRPPLTQAPAVRVVRPVPHDITPGPKGTKR